MIKGGIYLYPTSSATKRKLRLLYECNPLAFIRKAGESSDGFNGKLNHSFA
jgi:fructose-1,6-bisphosphatase I